VSYSIAQRAHPKGRSHWSWSLELAGPAEELDRVEWVEYTLHPTFSPPVHRVTDRASSFRLDGSGWGEFMVHVAVRVRGGETISLQHWLELDSNARPRGFSAPSKGALQAPPPPPPAPAPAPGRAPASPPAAGGAPPAATEPQRRTVYLSSGLADRSAALLLREALEAAGVEVRTGNDISSPGDSIESMIATQIGAADGAIFLVSDRESPWVRHELAVARELSVPLSIVRMGTNRTVLPAMGPDASMVTDMPPTGASAADARPVAEWATALPVRNKRPGSHA
jgi:hypothetical protein